MKFCSLVLVVLLTACGAKEEPKNEWVQNELLTQMAELRVEVAALKTQLSAIDSKVDKIQSAPVAKAAPARRPVKAPKQVDIPTHSLMGDKDAPVVIVEYTDYQCPYCARHSKNTLPLIKKKFVDTGKVQYAVGDYPLGFHSQAKAAAVAAQCAAKQGKFWKMHDQIFSNAAQVREGKFEQMAAELSLDTKQFSVCLNDKNNAELIDASVAKASGYGVTGTPKFFIGRLKDGVMVDVEVVGGASPIESFEAIVNKKLIKK